MALRFAPEAVNELHGIWDYIAEESGSTKIADKVVDSILRSIFLLTTHPNMGRRRDEDLRPGLRSFPTGEYVILYRIEAKKAIVLHVAHGRRDMEKLFGQ